MEFSGVSIPENSIEFYEPVIAWIHEYAKDPKPNSKISFKLAYLNTSSLQAIYDVLISLENKSVEVEWYYLSDDADMKEIGEDFQNAVNVKISLIEVIGV